MYQVINQLIYGHVQLIDESIKKQHRKLKQAYATYTYNKQNPYIKNRLDIFDELFDDLENSDKKMKHPEKK